MEKLRKVISQSKTFIIAILVLWVILAIILVSPIAYCVRNAQIEGTGINLSKLFDTMLSFSSIKYMFSEDYFGTYVKTLGYFTIAFLILSFAGFLRSKPKGDYHDMEHGSSDWSEHGEQYKVLNKNKGLILAEDNYLPIDKRGNINTLIVGRIWIW